MSGKICPLAGECIEHRCAWYTHVIGAHPQTGEAIDRFDCAVAMLPMLMIEAASAARQSVAQLSEGNELNKQALRSAAMGGATQELQRMIGVDHEH
jgi:hypothetical protein